MIFGVTVFFGILRIFLVLSLVFFLVIVYFILFLRFKLFIFLLKELYSKGNIGIVVIINIKLLFMCIIFKGELICKI